MTKEMKLPIGLEKVILKNEIDLPKTPVNQVKDVGTELRMLKFLIITVAMTEMIPKAKVLLILLI